MCHSSDQYPPDRPDFRCNAWTNFKTHLEAEIPFNPELHNVMAFDKSVENVSGAVLKALTASTPRRHPGDDARPPVPAGIRGDISLKTGC
jgi:hypothetical protein